ncbi:hypothetical protein Tco_0355143 [Tanacetum coccineum]
MSLANLKATTKYQEAIQATEDIESPTVGFAKTPDYKGGTDNEEKDEKQSQDDKTGLGMEKTVKDKAKSKPESQSSQKVNRKVNWSKSKSTQVKPEAKNQQIKKYKFKG